MSVREIKSCLRQLFIFFNTYLYVRFFYISVYRQNKFYQTVFPQSYPKE